LECSSCLHFVHFTLSVSKKNIPIIIYDSICVKHIIYEMYTKETEVSFKSIKFNFRWKLLRYPFRSIFLLFRGRSCPLTLSVSANGGGGGMSREGWNEKRKRKREKKSNKKPCVKRKRLRFAGWENLRGAWRPSTRIWRVALVHRAGGTSNQRNLHHLLHSPSPSPPCFRARHPPPNRDSCRRRPVSRYRSSRRRYPRNPHRSPTSAYNTTGNASC